MDDSSINYALELNKYLEKAKKIFCRENNKKLVSEHGFIRYYWWQIH